MKNQYALVYVDGYEFKVFDNKQYELAEKEEEHLHQAQIVAWYDGIQNAGENTEHSYTATKWTNIANTSNVADINGATWTEDGLLFDGTDDWVDLNTILIPETENFTVDMVLSLSSYQDCAYIIAQWTSGTSRWGFFYEDSQFKIFSGDGSKITTNYNPKLNQKVNITLVRDGVTKIYINGNKVAEDKNINRTIDQVNTVLGRWGTTHYYWNGIIYSVKSYDRELTDKEIRANYNINNLRYGIENIGDVRANQYITQNLSAWYDGHKNAGENTEHSYTTSNWVNLVNQSATSQINGATWTENGLLFDGTDDWVELNTILVPETEKFTLEMVMSLNKYASLEYFFAQHNTNSSNDANRLGINYTGEQIQVFLGYNNVKLSANTGYNPRVNQKFNVSIVRDGTIKIYINGNKAGEFLDNSIKIAQINTVLGRWGNQNVYYANGIIYCLRAYSNALSESQLIQNYEVDKARFNI